MILLLLQNFNFIWYQWKKVSKMLKMPSVVPKLHKIMITTNLYVYNKSIFNLSLLLKWVWNLINSKYLFVVLKTALIDIVHFFGLHL